MPLEQINKLHGISRVNQDVATQNDYLRRSEMSCHGRANARVRQIW